jgi:HK97 family phage major capsid protein
VNAVTTSVAARQILDCQREAEALSLRKMDKVEEQRFSFLLNKISTLRTGITEDPAKAAREELRSYLRTCPEVSRFALEQRTYQPITEPNSFVPSAYFRELMLGVAQYTPLFDKNTIRLIELDNSRPMTVPALDLSLVTAQVIGQGQDLAPTVNPVAGSMSLGQFTYRSNPIAASLELEMDSFESISEIMTQAFTVGMARGIGADMINGDGSTAPLGLLNAAGDSGVTTQTTGVISADDIKAIYFSLNRAYRVSPKCAWIMNETLYKNILGLVDSTGRPLIRYTFSQSKKSGPENTRLSITYTPTESVKLIRTRLKTHSHCSSADCMARSTKFLKSIWAATATSFRIGLTAGRISRTCSRKPQRNS